MDSWTILEAHLSTITFKKGEKGKRKKNELREHTQRVISICEEFIKQLETQGVTGIKIDLLRDAATLHDIAKYNADGKKYDDHNDNGDKHNAEAVRVLSSKYHDEIKDLNDICAIIRVHSGDFDPDKRIGIEAAILRIADKLDRFNEYKRDAMKKCAFSIDEIIRNLCNNCIDVGPFVRVYSEIYDNKSK
jgi:HD superfamily phosphodiesterase